MRASHATTRSLRLLVTVVLSTLLPATAFAADFDGSGLSAWWGLPFAGILLSIALMPLLTPAFWHHHYGKVAAGWALAFLLPFAAIHGPSLAAAQLLHALLAEYIPFIVLLTALFVVAGGSTSAATCTARRDSTPRSWRSARCSQA